MAELHESDLHAVIAAVAADCPWLAHLGKAQLPLTFNLSDKQIIVLDPHTAPKVLASPTTWAEALAVATNGGEPVREDELLALLVWHAATRTPVGTDRPPSPWANNDYLSGAQS
jgi:hypothetical protein